MPIGALTSQNFANFYLSAFDRFLLEETPACGIVRYMDDVVWWCHSKQEANSIAAAAPQVLDQRLALEIRPPIQVNRSDRGVSLCGYRVFPGTIHLSRRRRKLYQLGRRRWEAKFAAGLIGGPQLQAAYAATLGITLHSDATAWRQNQLNRHPPLEECQEI